MIVDADRHVAVADYRELLQHMDASWQKHFERTEFIGSIGEASNHIRVSNGFGEPIETSEVRADVDVSLLVPHQGITINGWADQVAATVFAGALNSYARENWATESAFPAIVVSAHDPTWSAQEIRRRAEQGGFGAIALPFGPTLFGSKSYDPIYEAAHDVDLPIVVHYSGIEGRYAGAAGLGGGVHANAFSRQVLMPQLAESNISSLAFEGVFERFPDVRFLFSSMGFSWLPSLLWRLDREWRTFRHDVPWVKKAPSLYVLEHVWMTTWPLAEATMDDDWSRLFIDESLKSRIVFGSHDPFGGDAPSDVISQLGESDGQLVLQNGSALLRAKATVS